MLSTVEISLAQAGKLFSKSMMAMALLWGVSGCATPQQRAANMSQAELCYRIVYSAYELSNAARSELSRRGLVCEPGMAAAENARREANNAAIGAWGAAMIQQGQTPIQAAPPPAPVNCVSTRLMNGQVVTNCR